MNNLAITPYIGLHALQLQNVKRNIVKKASIEELNNESSINQNIVKNEVPESNPQLNSQLDLNSTSNSNSNNSNNNSNIIIPEPMLNNNDNNFGSEIN